jgi:hypothetical protein
MSAKLCFALRSWIPGRAELEAELRESVFSSRAWEQGTPL